MWSSTRTDEDGRHLEDFILNNNLNIINPPKENLRFISQGITFVDITIAGAGIAMKVAEWQYVTKPSLSDQFYIYFTVNFKPQYKNYNRRALPKIDDVDTHLAIKTISSILTPAKEMTNATEIDDAIQHLTAAISTALNISKLPHKPIKKKTPWWNHYLCGLRHQLWQAQKKSRINTENERDFREIKAHYQKEIRKAKSESWKRFCKDEFESDPFKAIQRVNGRCRRLQNIASLRTGNNELILDEAIILRTLADNFFPICLLDARP